LLLIGAAITTMIVVVAAIVVAARSAPVSITEARVSLDGRRLELILGSCNADIHVDLNESTNAVVVDVTRSDAASAWLAGGDCEDLAYVDLDEPLGSRHLRDASRNTTVAISQPVPGEGDEPDWPYNTSRVSESKYAAAVQAVVACLERLDPDVTAWVVPGLNWPYYDFTKPPVNGNMTIDVIDDCEHEHLDPLR
jgi:hypothetical protein